MSNIIHCIDHEAAKNEWFTFKHSGRVYTGTIEYDADCFDGEYVPSNTIGIITDSDGNENETMRNHDELIEDIDELIGHIEQSDYIGSHAFVPFKPYSAIVGRVS